MAIEGPLKELGIHDVFQLLDLSRKTGVLRVTSDLRNNEGRVWFENGAILFAQLRSNPHPLGELLVRAGKITEADLQRARDMQEQQPDRPIGEVLVEIGAITEKELDRQVRFQTEEVIFEMMGWHEGHFSFEEGHDQAIPADATTNVRTEALLMEGARRIDEWSRISRTIPHTGVVPAFAASGETKEGDLDLLPAEWEVLAAIDGERDVRSVAQYLNRSEFDVAKTIFGLESAGVLIVNQPKTAQSSEPLEDASSYIDEVEIAVGVRDFDRARSMAEEGLKAHPQSAELHMLLAKVFRAGGEYTEAEDYCRRALRLDSMLTETQRLMGDVLALQGRFTEAVEWWDRWLRIQDGSADPHPDTADVRKAVQAAQLLHNLLKVAHG
jgi:tetratricopeptide (TPR) repeat protein